MCSHTHLVRYRLTLIHILSGFEPYFPTGELTRTMLVYTHGGVRQWTNLSTCGLAITSERASDTSRDCLMSGTHRQYSRDLKDVVVYQANTLNKSTTAIAKDLDMPLCIVQCVLKIWNEIGEAVDVNCRAKGKQGSLLNGKATEVCKFLIRSTNGSHSSSC